MESIEGLLLEALKLEQNGHLPGAEFRLLQLLEIEENHEEARRQLVALYSTMPGMLPDALRHAESLFSLSRNSRCARLIASLQRTMGHNGEAIHWLHTALECDDTQERHRILFELARIYAETNRPERSRRYLRMALHYEKNFREALRLLETLEESPPVAGS